MYKMESDGFPLILDFAGVNRFFVFVRARSTLATNQLFEERKSDTKAFIEVLDIK